MGKRQDVSYPKLCAICEIQMELERPAVHVVSGCALVEKDLYQVKDSAWLRHTDPANPEQPLNGKPYCHQAVVPGFYRTHIILYGVDVSCYIYLAISPAKQIQFAVIECLSL